MLVNDAVSASFCWDYFSAGLMENLMGQETWNWNDISFVAAHGFNDDPKSIDWRSPDEYLHETSGWPDLCVILSPSSDLLPFLLAPSRFSSSNCIGICISTAIRLGMETSHGKPWKHLGDWNKHLGRAALLNLALLEVSLNYIHWQKLLRWIPLFFGKHVFLQIK